MSIRYWLFKSFVSTLSGESLREAHALTHKALINERMGSEGYDCKCPACFTWQLHHTDRPTVKVEQRLNSVDTRTLVTCVQCKFAFEIVQKHMLSEPELNRYSLRYYSDRKDLVLSALLEGMPDNDTEPCAFGGDSN